MTFLPPNPFTRDQFLALGLGRRELVRLLDAGEVVRLRRGLYAQPTKEDPRKGWEGQVDQHLQRLSTALATRPGHAATTPPRLSSTISP